MLNYIKHYFKLLRFINDGLLTRDGFNNKVEVIMWYGRIKLAIGTWLILSGFISPLQNPINMVVIGFITVICCFNSYRIWQTAATGTIGLRLFFNGMHDVVSLSPRIMVSSMNFLFVWYYAFTAWSVVGCESFSRDFRKGLFEGRINCRKLDG
jgi:hypothetical protein